MDDDSRIISDDFDDDVMIILMVTWKITSGELAPSLQGPVSSGLMLGGHH